MSVVFVHDSALWISRYFEITCPVSIVAKIVNFLQLCHYRRPNPSLLKIKFLPRSSIQDKMTNEYSNSLNEDVFRRLATFSIPFSTT